MKKFLILFFLISIIFSMTGCGGDDSGSSSSPQGENPGVPSVFKLYPTQYIAQTNGYIYLKAKVLDGNGTPVKNTPVTFTNLSPIGKLSASNIVVVNTDDYGIATAHLYSTNPGFVTILAQVYTGIGEVRDRKTVFFTSSDVLPLSPSMALYVDSYPGGNGIYNESSDFILFDPPPDPDDTVLILATVRDIYGLPTITGITWGTDHPDEVNPIYTDNNTNENGEAKTIVQIIPDVLRETDTFVSIYALADNGAFNMVTLFLKPVVIKTITVTADPTTVVPEDTSDITATVTLSSGAAGTATDGMTVNFASYDASTCTDSCDASTCDPTPCGTITPFGQITDGVAPATFTAPATEVTCRIIASVGGVSGCTDVIVAKEVLAITPSTAVISGTLGGTLNFTISGGTAPYVVQSGNAGMADNDSTGTGLWNVATDGGTIAVTIPASTAAGDVTLYVTDSDGKTATATITII
jgi:hypothetical protein